MVFICRCLEFDRHDTFISAMSTEDQARRMELLTDQLTDLRRQVISLHSQTRQLTRLRCVAEKKRVQTNLWTGG